MAAIDYQTGYFPTGEDMKEIKKPSTTYDNSSLTISQKRRRQLENAGLSRGADNKALDPQRSINSSTSQNRMGFNASKLLNKASGVEKFNPYPTATKSTPNQSRPQLNSQEPDMATQYRNISSADLDRVKGLDNQELQANINRVTKYQPLANNEANRAMKMSLATQFPYKKYETESSSAREIMNNAQSAIPTFLNRATASRVNPVSLSL